jgi:integrase/recombinase XerD
MEDFSIISLQHRGMNCVGVRVPKGDPRLERVRQIPHMRWSQTHNCWYAPATEGCWEAVNAIFFVLKEPPNGDGPRENSSCTPEEAGNMVNTFPNPLEARYLQRFLETMQVRNYAEETQKNYTQALTHFLKHFRGRDIPQLTNTDLERYQMEAIIAKQLSQSYQNMIISAVKLFYEKVLGRKVDPEFISRPRRERPLPDILSMQEIARMIQSVKNQKHRAMLGLIYGCGLRSGELLNLKLTDIPKHRNVIHLRAAKGSKDRLVPLSEKLRTQLREYYKIYKPKTYLFEGETEGAPYSKRSLQMVFKRALAQAKLSNIFRLHNLRHSYATHLLEAGTNEAVIQTLLGHASIKTTTIYTKVAQSTIDKIYNPFDHLDL